jgi:hypothetical protein
MSIEKIQQLEADIKQANADHQAFLEKQEAERQEAEARRDERISQLQAERDALALEMKLAEYPKKLVTKHKTCSVCGAQMRPVKVANPDGSTQKFWACQAGNLQDTHDLVIVPE